MLSVNMLILRLGLAAVCGALIGYQRERKDRPAGFRTHILVSVGSALFMIVSIFNFPGPRDPTRIAAQVVTGIGFLGAGSILRQGNIVIGLTTAASLWSVAAIGLAAGAGYYTAAAAGALIIFLVLSLFKFLEERIAVKRYDARLVIQADDRVDIVKDISERLAQKTAQANLTGVTRRDHYLEIIYELKTRPDLVTDDALSSLLELKDVRGVRCEDLAEHPVKIFDPSQ